MIDQGDAQIDEATLWQVHLEPYLAALRVGAKSIMVSYSSWNGIKMHAHHELLTVLLKHEFGFDGFLVSDWGAIDQLSADYSECVVRSINAGLDMIMVPYEYQRFIHALQNAVLAGDIPIERIDDAVRRILNVKYEFKLDERKMKDEPDLRMLGSIEHRQVAREAVRKSLVVLKNDHNTIPFDKNIPSIVIAGVAGDNIGLQCGGWTIEWQGGTGDITVGTSLLKAIRKSVSAETIVHFDPLGRFPEHIRAEVGIVCLNEHPYAEGVGDRADLTLGVDDLTLIQLVRNHCQKLAIVLFSGRPLIIADQLPLAEAWVAAWLPGTEGDGITDVLFGDYAPVGKLPYRWPLTAYPIHPSVGQVVDENHQSLFPLGYGLS
jgi:beta-glucosidase